MSTNEPNARVRIRHKADELFMRYGIRSVSMDEIASGLGISKKTIYQYFSDKNELVDAVVENILDSMRADCSQCSTRANDAVHEIFLTMQTIVAQFRNMNSTVVHDLEKYHDKAFRKLSDHKHKFLLEIVRNNLERGIREGLFRADIDMDVLSRFRLETMMMPFNITLFPSEKYQLTDVTIGILEHYVFGLASLKGHQLILQYKEERTKAKHYDTLPGSKAN
ncbi:MAG: TetR/AcrR family transcriptional regulator [Candidatus Pseudobacter hemicellulosilyticus]|uniref:TetR/AcrR family transcriptional regulator n=1 Tax=Candidatus Pseudobacter hemicellulosilyticus TaxID=3121375 RepID=A0AAJ5WW25_9BACT|nr:MAG: TetR/AcrR family transcriptional regulator [Pseudobacter sp.]